METESPKYGIRRTNASKPIQCFFISKQCNKASLKKAPAELTWASHTKQHALSCCSLECLMKLNEVSFLGLEIAVNMPSRWTKGAFLKLKHSWPTIPRSFGCMTVIWELYTLCYAHMYNYRLSPYNALTKPLTVFLMLYLDLFILYLEVCSSHNPSPILPIPQADRAHRAENWNEIQ